LTLVSFDP